AARAAAPLCGRGSRRARARETVSRVPWPPRRRRRARRPPSSTRPSPRRRRRRESEPRSPRERLRLVIEAHLTAELEVGGRLCPCYVHTLDHPDGLVLVDTGMIESTPELDKHWHPVIHPLPDELVRRVSQVVITHTHFDHIGGNRLFPGVPIHIQ